MMGGGYHKLYLARKRLEATTAQADAVQGMLEALDVMAGRGGQGDEEEGQRDGRVGQTDGANGCYG